MRWTEPASSPSPNLLPDLHPLAAQILIRRGFVLPAAAHAFCALQGRWLYTEMTALES